MKSKCGDTRQGGLAGSVRSNDNPAFIGFDRPVDIAENLVPVDRSADTGHLQHAGLRLFIHGEADSITVDGPGTANPSSPAKVVSRETSLARGPRAGS